MLTFFRNIRKGLFDSGQARKYILYAFGEIALVVIGILIALQISNWNEDRKRKVIELKLLKELHTTVIEDINFNIKNIASNEGSRNSVEVLIAHLVDDLPYHDSLLVHFTLAHQRWVAFIRDNAYQNANNYGLDFITNDSTKYLLTWTYQTHIQWLNKLDDRNNLYHYNIEAPFLQQFFTSSHPYAVDLLDVYENGGQMEILDYQKIRTSNVYLNVLRTNYQYRSEYLVYQSRLLKSLQKLAIRIEEEINLYKKEL